MLAGIYDYSCLGNTWIEPHSTLDGRSAISAGATSNITTVSVSGTTMTLDHRDCGSGWVASTWVTIAGTVNCNGTFKVLSGTSSNMTLNYPSGSCVSEAVGTAQKASSTSVFATLTARARERAKPHHRVRLRLAHGSSIQVWINPYQESNSAAPCWDTGTLVSAGSFA
jgi:phage tail sheath gpL-like